MVKHIVVQAGHRAFVLKVQSSEKVFVVHAHDHVTRDEVASFLRANDVEPVILDEQANEGMTLVEKFERHSKVSFAIILLTPDDVGYPRGRRVAI